ncbi:hypothetical protein HYV80_01635 [Candidatus Woesearchaeota archaeon]|nr:hypothetical protein [Candidatus Woesearchaeota archaeon]
MKKRGQIVYEALVVIIAGVLIITGFVQGGKSYGQQEAFYKLAVAKDIAVTIDLIYALPGNIEYTYPNDVSGYDIEIKNNIIKVYKTSSTDSTLQYYNYVGTDKDQLNFLVKSQKFLKIEKINGKIKITGVSG